MSEEGKVGEDIGNGYQNYGYMNPMAYTNAVPKYTTGTYDRYQRTPYYFDPYYDNNNNVSSLFCLQN